MAPADVAVPSSVSLAMERIAAVMKDGLLALAVQSGLAVMFALHADTLLEAEAALNTPAAGLEVRHPGAAASLREGMDETLTVLRLGVPPTPARTLRSANPIEPMISICRDHAVGVKNWKNGQMALRWCAAGMAEAAKQFRRVNGFLHLPKLQATLERHVASRETASACYNENVA